jgi:hypothetical protein
MTANGQGDAYEGDQNSNQQSLNNDSDMRQMSNQLFLNISSLLKETLFDSSKWKNALDASLRNLGKSVVDTSVRGIAKSIIPS